MAIAKNVSNLLATGDILVNLDCDNFIQKNDSFIIKREFKKENNIILHMSKYNKNTILFLEQYNFNIEDKYKKCKNDEIGDTGRICILRNNFNKLSGYDERFIFMGF